MRRLILLLTLIIGVLPITIASGSDELPPPPNNPAEIARLESAIQDSMGAERDSILALTAPDIQVANLAISQDGNWGVGWLIPIDPHTGEPAPIEPGVVITRRERGEWQVWHPAKDGWIEMVQAAPDEILSQAHKDVLADMYATQRIAVPTAALTGYLLPWEAGVTHFLTQSTCHDEYLSSGNAHYAFDFSTYGQLWNIQAAKGGVVWLWKEDVPTCYAATCSDTQSLGNYIVLKDETTNPVTYQLYLHLAYDSIPDELKVQGTPVNQGQFIGIVDNTGQSWGHHLHFQVQVPLYGESHYWGQSVDIVFNDVDINGGRPRVQNAWCNDQTYCDWAGDVCNEFQSAYISQNEVTTDSAAPEGDILSPGGYTTFTTSSLTLEGWATDEGSGLRSAQFIALYKGAWHEIGPGFSQALFSYAWDWCTDEVPDGPLSLALRLEDNQGNQNLNLPGLRHGVKHVDCPLTPNCIPTADQIAIFAGPNYTGQCRVLGLGGYSSSPVFGPVGDDDMEAVLVGDNVIATLFSAGSYSGRAETIATDDPNLSENRSGRDSVSSIKVIDRDSLPAAPTLTWPGFGVNFSEADSLSLVWNEAGGGVEFRSTLDGPPGTITTDWGTAATRGLGTLAPGIYSWRVQARNDFGESAWSDWQVFIVNAAAAPAAPGVTTPYSDTLEGDTTHWTTTGLWHLTETDSHSATHSWWYSQPVTGTYDTETVNYGDLTSPAIRIPVTTDPYILSFWTKSDTESVYSHWDQRWVQISVDEGEFSNIGQLTHDLSGGWLQAAFDLSPYYAPGEAHTLQIRFYISSIDAVNNDHAGWSIDDFQIEAVPAPACSDTHESNDDPSQATGIAYGDSLTAEICPGGDRDYYAFTGSAGDQIEVDVDAKTQGSGLDSILYLLAEDGSSVLAEHDDEVSGVRQDPHLGYRLPRDGSYHLKIQAWDSPMGTGVYTLTLTTDGVDPTLDSLSPASGIYLPAGSFNVSVNAVDSLSGMSQVQFLRYADGWQEISQDWDGLDGWRAVLDTSSLTEGQGIAIYARGFDWAGNWAGEGAWDIILDFSHPTTSADPLANPAESTALHLKWSATDNLSGIRRYHVRNRKNFESWSVQEFDSATNETWFVGEAGNDYTFRIRATDNAGNLEAYADGAEASATIPGIATICSTPDAWDVSNLANDNGPASATNLDFSWQTHNFCNPTAVDRLNDEDWFSFSAIQGQNYSVLAQPTHGSAAVVIQLYASDGTTLLAEESPAQFGASSQLNWTATQDGVVYVRLRHLDGRVVGNGVGYQVRVARAVIYFPLINK